MNRNVPYPWRRTVSRVSCALRFAIESVLVYLVSLAVMLGWVAAVFVPTALAVDFLFDLPGPALLHAGLAFLLFGVAFLLFVLGAILLANASHSVAMAVVQRRHDGIAAQVDLDLASGAEPRPYALYLRPFSADERLEVGLDVPNQLGADAWVSGAPRTDVKVDLEVLLTKAVRPGLDLVALGEHVGHGGAGRLSVTDAEWVDAFRRLVRGASVVFMVPATAGAARWEFEELLTGPAVAKAVFIIPPVGRVDAEGSGTWPDGAARAREDALAAFQGEGIKLPSDKCLGALVSLSSRRTIDSYVPSLGSFLVKTMVGESRVQARASAWSFSELVNVLQDRPGDSSSERPPVVNVVSWATQVAKRRSRIVTGSTASQAVVSLSSHLLGGLDLFTHNLWLHLSAGRGTANVRLRVESQTYVTGRLARRVRHGRGARFPLLRRARQNLDHPLMPASLRLAAGDSDVITVEPVASHSQILLDEGHQADSSLGFVLRETCDFLLPIGTLETWLGDPASIEVQLWGDNGWYAQELTEGDLNALVEFVGAARG